MRSAGMCNSLNFVTKKCAWNVKMEIWGIALEVLLAIMLHYCERCFSVISVSLCICLICKLNLKYVFSYLLSVVFFLIYEDCSGGSCKVLECYGHFVCGFVCPRPAAGPFVRPTTVLRYKNSSMARFREQLVLKVMCNAKRREGRYLCSWYFIISISKTINMNK